MQVASFGPTGKYITEKREMKFTLENAVMSESKFLFSSH
jgi:hypothetical protein